MTTSLPLPATSLASLASWVSRECRGRSVGLQIEAVLVGEPAIALQLYQSWEAWVQQAEHSLKLSLAPCSLHPRLQRGSTSTLHR